MASGAKALLWRQKNLISISVGTTVISSMQKIRLPKELSISLANRDAAID